MSSLPVPPPPDSHFLPGEKWVLQRNATDRARVVQQAGFTDRIANLMFFFLPATGHNSLEKPCMDHMPWLLERGAEAGGEPCGHALMATCPPEPFPELTADIPFGYSNVKGADIGSSQRTWELSKGDLSTLLALSSRLNLDGEITPVMAWSMVLTHPRLAELTPRDFERLTEELSSKVRCYG